MDFAGLLEDLGLTKQESEVYLSLLKKGLALASETATATRINRSVTYKILSELIRKGFTTYVVKENIRYYSAVDPEKLEYLLKQKQNKLKEMLPGLKKLQEVPKEKRPLVEIFEGKEGIRTMLWDILRVKKDWFAFNAPGKGRIILGPLADAFEKERQKARITLNVLSLKTKESLERASAFEKMKYTNVRYVHESYDSPASTWIYGDRVAILFWKKEFPFALRIIDAEFAESYKKYFEELWTHADKKA